MVRTYIVQTVDRALDILNCFSRQRLELSASEISRQAGLDKSTTTRLLSTLVAGGYLQRDPQTQRFRLGFRVLALADLILRETSLTVTCRPLVLQLRDATGETVGIFVRAGASRVVIEQVESLQDIRRVLALGRPGPLFPGAAGPLFYCTTPAERLPVEAERLAGELGADAASVQTWLSAKLDEFARLGYVTSIGETSPDVFGVAAPLRRAGGEVVAVLAVYGPASRATDELLRRCGSLTREAALQISQMLGG